jgi:uncharacterized protein (TIGR03067 family)
MVEDGRPGPCRGRTLSFAPDGTFVARHDGEHQGAGTYEAEPSHDPPQVDLAEPGSAPFRGIWRVEGDTLTLCVCPDPQRGRPSAFAAPDESGCVLATLKRVKKSE